MTATFAANDFVHGLVGAVRRELPAAIELRRELHQFPELGGFEDWTRARLADELSDFEVEPAAETGLTVRVGSSGPSIALRAEMDGLPIEEETDVGWASDNGAMHACGHDVHMAAMVAVLRAARTLQLPGDLLGVFQPREEVVPAGAVDILDEGVFLRHDVRAIVGVHVQPQVEKGTVSAELGVVNAAADEFEIVVHGRGGHGAYPHSTVDPIAALTSIMTGLYELVSRKIDPMHPTVVTVGMLRAGDAANVIPSHATLRGTIRTSSEADRAALHAEMRMIATHVSASRGATAEVRIVQGEPALRNDTGLVRATRAALTGVLPLARVPFRSCGADDFAHYCGVIPSLMAFVGTGRAADGPLLHHSQFLPPDEAVAQVAQTFIAGYVGGLVSQELLT